MYKCSGSISCCEDDAFMDFTLMHCIPPGCVKTVRSLRADNRGLVVKQYAES